MFGAIFFGEVAAKAGGVRRHTEARERMVNSDIDSGALFCGLECWFRGTPNAVHLERPFGRHQDSVQQEVQ